MTSEQVYDEFVVQFRHRKFVAGVLVAAVDLWNELEVPGSGLDSFAALKERFPLVTDVGSGRQANTLILARPDGSHLSLRRFYDAAETYFRATEKRFDFPSCAPHATQSWRDYVTWLDALTGMSAEELASLRARVVAYVLEALPSHEFDPASVVLEPPLFSRLLESFDMAPAGGEKTGAAFQGVVFGFVRADNPHLQIEIEKVRTGSKRLQRVGDIDGWEGARLAITAEVKGYRLEREDAPTLAAFANEATKRGALGIVAALGFGEGMREEIEGMGVRALDREEMRRIVELWDPIKQRTAVQSFVYYTRHIEKSSALAARLDAFLVPHAPSPAASSPVSSLVSSPVAAS